MHAAEALLKEIYVEIKRPATGGDLNFYVKPIQAYKAKQLIEYVGQLKSQVEQYKKAFEAHQKSTVKLDKAMSGIEAIATNEFPKSGAKVDLIQEQATKLWIDLQKM